MKCSLVIATLGTALLVSIFAIAQTQVRGTWSANLIQEQPGHLQLELFRPSAGMHSGQPVKITELKGLDASAINGSNVPVKFQLQHDAGTFDFNGTFNQGLGHGEFNFTANQQFISDLKGMGFADVEKQVFAMAMIDVTRAYAHEVRELGFNIDTDELIEGAIFHVGRAQIEGLKSVGVTDLGWKKLVEFQIFKVTPEYIREMRAAFPNISMDKMVEMRIHKATPEFAKEMAQLGYSGLSAEELVNFRIHGVTPEFIREVRELGFKDLSPEQLVEFKIFGVGAEQIRELAKEGYTNLTPRQLVDFRIHHVDANFIEKVKKAGYAHPSPSQLVEFRIMGIRMPEPDI